MLNFIFAMLITVIGDSQGGIAVPILRSQGHRVVDLHKDGIRVEATCRTQVARIGTPEVVIVFLGSNHYDDSHAPNVSCVLHNLPVDSKCIWVGPPYIRDLKYKGEDELRKQVEGRCIYVSEQEIRDLPDKIHPRGKSAKAMVEKILPYLR